MVGPSDTLGNSWSPLHIRLRLIVEGNVTETKVSSFAWIQKGEGVDVRKSFNVGKKFSVGLDFVQRA
jgi:hypothetical protein